MPAVATNSVISALFWKSELRAGCLNLGHATLDVLYTPAKESTHSLYLSSNVKMHNSIKLRCFWDD